MWSSRLFWRILIPYGGLAVLVAIGCLVATSRWQRRQVMDQVQQRLRDTAVILRALVETEGDSSASQLSDKLGQLREQTQTRLTLIDANGVVLADSDEPHARMNNHLDRPEVQQALREGQGSAQRTSTTLSKRMYYVALSIPGKAEVPKAYVRVAMPMEDVELQVSYVQQRLWSIVVGAGFASLVITYFIVGRLVGPLRQLTRSAQEISAGRYGDGVSIQSNDEIGLLGHAFETMRRQLIRQVDQLGQQAHRQATVFRNMLEGIIVVDRSGQITLANQASIRLLNFTTHEPEGKELGSITSCRQISDIVASALDGEDTGVSEVEIRGNDIRTLSVQVTRLPGKPSPGVVAVVRDVTELRKLENMRRDFAANVSHELKTPLTSIKAYAETLRLGAVYDQENSLSFVKRIEEQAERLHQLILDLLQLSRIESGEEVLDIRDVALSDVIIQAITYRQDAASTKGIAIKLETPDQPLTIHADEEGVRTVLDNLIDNAIKYTPEGGTVTVRWLQEGDMVLIEVTDTGIGISQGEQARVFERFHRVDKARSRELGGTGLGLSIVKHMTQSLGGTVGIRSQLGQGSTFEIRLPAGESALSH